MLLRRDRADFAEAEQALQTAVAIARQQGTRAFELRAALSLAKLLQSTARLVEAHTALAPALEGFSPTSVMPEIAEAQSLLVALAESDEVRAAITQRERRFRLQTAYSQAMMWSKGYAAEDTKAAFARAVELAGKIGDFSERLVALHGQWAATLVGGELRSARDLALALLPEAEDAGRAWEVGIANRMLGLTAYFRGDFVAAKTFCERALEAPDTKPDLNLGERLNADSLVSSAYLAPTMWALGQVQRARELIDAATQRAAEVDTPAMADALHWKVDLEIWRNDPFAALRAAEALKVVARQSTMAQWLNLAELATGWARGRIDDPVGGAAQVRRALAHFLDQGVRTDVGFLSGLLAELEAKTLGGVSGLARIEEAVRLALQFDNRYALSFLHRIRGEILVEGDPTKPAPAEEAYETAITIAKEQGARSFELLASFALAKLYQSTARPVEAHAVLAPALEGFAPTPEMPEIAEAQAVLAALAETDEVKTAAAARRRRLKLQTDYGQAMMFSKGYGAEETRAAFADALKIAAGTANAAGRFATYYGIWAGCMDRGDLTQARQIAETFRREARDPAYAPSFARACVCLGMAILTQGDPSGARAHLVEALKTYDPGWDREAKLRFGTDVGALASAYLASATWLLGDVVQARELIEQAVARATQSQHAPTKAFICSRTAQLEALRGDAEAMLSASETMVELSQNYGLKLYLAWGKTYRGWARSRLGDREAGVRELREGLAGVAAQGSRQHVPLYQALLAEIEAEIGESELNRIDGALALARETGEHWSDSFLHRVRGEILLKLDPANAAAAEQAFRAAIAIARAQEARSFELQAALGLAKLYQSTARPADAREVLASAPEGFSTPEMPEIAEAQALLERLAHGGGAIASKDQAK
jgi:predicted ATPase